MKLFLTFVFVVALVGYSLADTKSELIAKGKELVTKAEEAIKKLEAANKTHEVSVLKTKEASIKKLITKLEAATDLTKITQLEADLKAEKEKLVKELEKVRLLNSSTNENQEHHEQSQNQNEHETHDQGSHGNQGNHGQ